MLIQFKKIFIILFLIFLTFQPISCFEDTCNTEPTFKSMDALLETSDSTNPIIVNLVWEIGDKRLPLEYFQDIFIDERSYDSYGRPWKNDWFFLDKIQVVDLNKLSLYFNNSISTNYDYQYDFHFSFADRKDFIPCVHPGSYDSYHLDVYITLKYENNIYTIEHFNWKEELHAGGW